MFDMNSWCLLTRTEQAASYSPKVKVHLPTRDVRQPDKNYNVSECRRFSRDRKTVK